MDNCVLMDLIVIGDSRHQILSHLLEQKMGATVEELMGVLRVSRTSINQHLAVLEREGYVRKAEQRRTAGRPVRCYALTENGQNFFPKKYSWFSKVLLSTLQEQLGDEKLSSYMYDLGLKMSADLIPRLVGKNRVERVAEIVRIMNETGFRASEIDAEPSDKLPRVECTNCVYHDLAKDYPAVCRFDIGFLSGLMGAEVEHQSCMHREATACRFRFKPYS